MIQSAILGLSPTERNTGVINQKTGSFEGSASFVKTNNRDGDSVFDVTNHSS